MSHNNLSFDELLYWFRHLEQEGISEHVLNMMWVNVIWFAIKGKYQNITRKMVDEIVINRQINKSNLYNLGVVDIDRQLLVLKKIEKYWRHEKLNESRLFDVYRLCCGISKNIIDYRNKDLILYGGIKTPVSPDLIENEMKKYLQLIEAANLLPLTASLSEKIYYSLRLYLMLIVIHPFPDGNGRTARLLLNLILRRWGLPYITLPKVRNDKKWLNELNLAIKQRSGSPIEGMIKDLIFKSLLNVKMYHDEELNRIKSC